MTVDAAAGRAGRNRYASKWTGMVGGVAKAMRHCAKQIASALLVRISLDERQKSPKLHGGFH